MRILVVLILVAAMVVGVIFAVRTLLENSTENARDTSRESLVSTTSGRAVKMYARGRIVAAENFKSYVIDITPSTRSLTVYTGYDGTVTKQISAANTTASYEQFVYALDHSGYMNGKELTGDANDTRGVCPTGQLYEFSILNNGDTLKKLWSSSCSNTPGSMSGKLEPIRKLFISQIDGAADTVNTI